MGRLLDGLSQYFDEDGKMLSGGKLYFYETGSTTTKKAIYSDVGETSALSNPQSLDTEGRLSENIFGTGAYNVRLYKVNADLSETLIDEADPMGDVAGSQFADWNSLQTYNNTSLVTGSNGNYYKSLTNDNQNNDPTTDATKWEQIEFIYYYNASRTYAANDRVRDTSGNIYTSLQAANLNKTPSSNPDYWRKNGSPVTINYTTDQTIDANELLNTLIITNTSASGALNHTLGPAIVGGDIAFRVDAAQYLRATLNGTDTVSYGLLTSAGGGYVRTNKVGVYWRMRCFVTGEWTITELTEDLNFDK